MSGHLLLFCLISVTAVPLADSTVQQDIIKYIGQIKIIRNMLAAENCEDPHTHDVDMRETLGTGNHLDDIELEVQRKQYQRLRDVLIECRIAASRTTTASTTISTTPRPPTTIKNTVSTTTTPRPPTTIKTTNPTTTTPRPTTTIKTTIPTTTTLRPTTTPTPLPAMCLLATNLTEWWRKDYRGSLLLSGDYKCDTKNMIAAGRPWFRFSGAAGNRLMNKCVPLLSCGTAIAFWSDDPMPTQVGIITEINVYAQYSGNCRNPRWTKKISVVRCSTSATDYVYRYDDVEIDDNLCYGFCGMLA